MQATSELVNCRAPLPTKRKRSFGGLGPSQQEVARHILARLVRLSDESGEHTRQRIPLAALYSEEILNKDAGRKVLDQLTQARLVTVAVASDHCPWQVAIAHEALV